MLGGIHKPIVPVEDKPSTTWHHIRGKFKYLFAADKLELIERWYNTVAPRRHRDQFRDVMKSISKHDVKTASAGDALQQHRATTIMRLYGDMFTPEGVVIAKSWVISADLASAEKFKDVLTATQAMLTPISQTKRIFVPKEPLPEIDPKKNFHKKIDWESQKTAQFIRDTTYNPMDTNHPAGSTAPPAKKRFTKPKGQFDGFDVKSQLGLDDEGLEKLAQERKQFELEAHYVVDGEGCTNYKTKTATKASKEIANRIVVTSLGNSAGAWISANRELLRHPGMRSAEIVDAEKHPAIARTTASLGFCVPHRAK